MPTQPEKQYKNKAGWWTTQSEGGTQVTADTIVKETDTVVWARWSDINVAVTFNANGGAFSDGSTSHTEATEVLGNAYTLDAET
ncbi:MAG: hypothetical protein Q4F54_05010 [Coriobacteriia bacterium]|nr:hypothetical protein [Coriobacteriia bacterium]